MNTRNTILVSVLLLLLVALGVWWYMGFSLDFMRFFAAEPGVVSTPTPSAVVGSKTPVPSGCTLVQVQCIQAPCPPIVECPRVSCVADKTTVAVGTSVSIQAYGGAGGYVFTAPEGTLAMVDASGGNASGVAAVTYDAPGTKQVFVTSKRSSDNTLTDVAVCSVTVIPAAVTNQ